MFTLASLLDKDEEFRLHLYVPEDLWNHREIKWAIDNFSNIKIYQVYSKQDATAKSLINLKNWWKDKNPGLNKRIIVGNGNRIFLRKITGNEIPGESFFKKNLSFIDHKYVFRDHPQFKNFYRRLDKPIVANSVTQQDPEFMLINWEVMKKFNDQDLFFFNNAMPSGGLDERIANADNKSLMKNLMTYNYNYVPTYMNGTVDWLIQLDAIGLRDIVNYNVMLRKSYSLNIQNQWLTRPYKDCPTGIQLGVPWDCYTNLIDKIPLQFRNHRLNENLLIKAEKQKATMGSLAKVGYRLGKI